MPTAEIFIAMPLYPMVGSVTGFLFMVLPSQTFIMVQTKVLISHNTDHNRNPCC
jgi:hypothetical protein